MKDWSGRMDKEMEDLVILYGSQTGTGEDVAERVGREALRHNLYPTILPMNSFDFEKLPNTSLIVFIASTTGQGEEPSNMKTFWKKLLKRSLPSQFLSEVSFSVLGLGDSSYVKFNFVAKKLFKRLQQLGASGLIPLFLGDDQHELGPDAVIDQWLEALWVQLPSSRTDHFENELPPRSKFSIIKSTEIEQGCYNEIEPILPKSVWKCQLIENKRVTSDDHFQDVRLVSIDLGQSGLKYEAGDVLVVQPSNSIENVTEFFKLFPNLEVIADEEFKLDRNLAWARIPSELQQLLPFPWTWGQVVRHYFDLQGIPKRYFFELLSKFTTSDLEREKLIEFSSAEGQQELYNYCNRPKRNVLEVLADFPYALPNIPLEYLFDLILPIKPRSFSIASSMTAQGRHVQILVAIVNYQSKLKKRRLGLCSNWLANLSPGSEVPIWIQPGSFHFPLPSLKNSVKQTVIMVGPGTGVAPFRSFISERTQNPGIDFTLFFGCRFYTKDFYFEHEWNQLQEGQKLRIFTAFSRDNPDKVTYVQHKIEEVSALLWNLIHNQEALIYVAGNAKRMPIDVADAFKSVFKENGVEDPELYLKQLVKVNRYQTEVWS